MHERQAGRVQVRGVPGNRTLERGAATNSSLTQQVAIISDLRIANTLIYTGFIRASDFERAGRMYNDC